MLYVTRMAEWNRVGPDGAAQRATWELAAKQGNADALAKMQLPEFPESIGYLHEWFHELSAGRGASMNGIAGLTYEGIESWARLTDRSPEPYEVNALFVLDNAWRGAMQGESTTSSAQDVAAIATPRKAWPSKKPEPVDA